MKTRACLTLIALGFLTFVVGVEAQQRWEIESSGGIAFVSGDIGDITDDVGASVATSISYKLMPRLGLRLGGAIDFLSGESNSGGDLPDIRLWHYGAGVDLMIFEAPEVGWGLRADLGVGAATVDSDSFTADGVGTDFTETYFAANGGLTLGYNFSRSVNLFVDGKAFFVFADEDDTKQLSDLSANAEPFDTAVTVPIRAGIAFKI